MTSFIPKYGLPISPTPTIERPRLLENLRPVLGYKVTLIAAPPGYGKTTVVAQFAHQATLPVAWHTVEGRERDLPNFVAHCAEAFSSVLHNFVKPQIQAGAAIHEAATLITEQLRNVLVGDMIYVLDDIQNVVGSPNVEQWLQAFIETIPSKVHLILVGRSLPALPMLELVTHREVLALGHNQLRFSFEEIQQLASQMELVLSPLEIQKIMTKFDGWIAGSVLALQPLPVEIAAEIFGEGHSPEAIFDVLAEVMLRAQDNNLQDFLLSSSTLSRMTPTLCQVVLQLHDSKAYLDEVIHLNMFVREIAGGLSFHPLFRDFLQRHLSAHDPYRFVELHRRAGRWFEEHNRMDEAFDHYISAGSFKESSAIADRAASAYFAQGMAETVLYWRRQLSNTAFVSAQFLFVCANINIYRYEYDLAEEELTRAGDEFQQQDDNMGVVKVRLTHANMENLRGQPQRAVELAQSVLEHGDIQPNLRGYAHAILGRAFLSIGNMGSALQNLELALPLYRTTGDAHAIAHLLLALEIAYLRVGRFEESSALLQEAIGLLRALGNDADLLSPLINLGYSYHLLGDYQQASSVYHEALDIAARVSEKRAESHLLGSLADLDRDRGAFDEAIDLYRKALKIVGTSEPALRCRIMVNFATLQRWQENLEASSMLANEAAALANNHQLPFEAIAAQVVLSAIRAQQGEPKEAGRELERLTNELSQLAEPMQWSQAVMLSAFAALLSGESAAAHQRINVAIKGAVHDTVLQPAIAEIVHTPLLNSFVQLHSARYPSLVKSSKHLESAMRDIQVKEVKASKTTSERTYSLRVWVLGQERFERDGVAVPLPSWRSITARELFLYLLLKGKTTREQFGAILWPDATPEQLRANFHATLHRARNAVGTNTIKFEDDLYFVDPDVDVMCDAIEFTALVQKARVSSSLRAYTEELWHRAVRVYQGDLLPFYEAGWLVPQREAVQQMYLEALLALGTCIRTRGDFSEALATFRRAIEIDPYREDIHRAILTCYAGLGERSQIQRELESLTQFLDAELGVNPSVETITLAQSLLS